MKVSIRFFAVSKELTGEDAIVLDLPTNTTSTDLLHALVARYPLLKPWQPYLRLAVNCEYSAGGATLNDGDDVAVIPPVSGG